MSEVLAERDSVGLTTAAAPKASVIMVVYFTGPALAQTLARVLEDPSVGELVIVENGASPDEVAVIDAVAAKPNVRLVRGQGNVGFARGANLGAANASGDDLIFLNPDAFLEPGCVNALVKALAGGPAPLLIGARVLNPDGHEQRGARRGEVTPFTTLLSLTRLSQKLRGLRGFEIHHESEPAPDAPIPTPTISGACFAMTREGFKSVGGFDEGFFLHVEDVDLCWRVRQSGGAVMFHPGARVVHLGSTSLKAPVVVEFWKGLGLARYFRKRAKTPARALLAWLLGPFIVMVSVARPILRGQIFKPKARR